LEPEHEPPAAADVAGDWYWAKAGVAKSNAAIRTTTIPERSRSATSGRRRSAVSASVRGIFEGDIPAIKKKVIEGA
jgi:hypothetical protein